MIFPCLLMWIWEHDFAAILTCVIASITCDRNNVLQYARSSGNFETDLNFCCSIHYNFSETGRKKIYFTCEQPGKTLAIDGKFYYSYVKDLADCIQHYLSEMNDNNPDMPPALRGKQNVIFGNITELYNFHW